jgi:mxaA protein
LKKRTKKLLLLLLLVGTTPALGQVRSVELLTPTRDFGYIVGDVIATDAIITASPGTTLDRQALPVPGPLNPAIELRSIGVQETAPGNTTEIRIHAEYQTFLAPERVSETEIPGFSVHLTTGTAHSTAAIPAWPFHVSPLRAAQRSIDDISDLRQNHAIEPVPEGQYGVRLLAAAAAALAAALALARVRGWLPGWRNKTRPFAMAEHRIRSLGHSEDQAAYQELHRAFDATAGHHLFKGDLQSFFQSYPRFTLAQAEISRFFAASESCFFARDGDTRLTQTDVSKLARLLRRLERRR